MLRNPIFLWFFRGGGSGPPVPPFGSVHGHVLKQYVSWRGCLAHSEACRDSLTLCMLDTLHNFFFSFFYKKLSVSNSSNPD